MCIKSKKLQFFKGYYVDFSVVLLNMYACIGKDTQQYLICYLDTYCKSRPPFDFE